MIRSIPKKAVSVTPSDTNYIVDKDGNPSIGTLYIGVTGDVVCILEEQDDTNSTITTGVGGAKLFKSVPVGFFPCSVKKVFATGTTATNIIALID